MEEIGGHKFLSFGWMEEIGGHKFLSFGWMEEIGDHKFFHFIWIHGRGATPFPYLTLWNVWLLGLGGGPSNVVTLRFA
jgi:hypothetical protein